MAQAWVQPDRPRLTRSGLFLVAAILLFPAVAAFVAVAAPKLALLQHRSLPVLAANHLVTLGWGTMVAIGGLHALLPAAAGVRQDVPRVVPWQFGVHLWGVLILGASFWTRSTGGLIAGGGAIVASVLISAGAAWWTLARRTRWSWPLTYITVALGGLVAATTWGGVLAVNWRAPFWRTLLLPPGLTVHLTLGLVLWFVVLITGVSYYLLVRFTTLRTLDATHVRPVFVLLVAASAAILTGAFTFRPVLRGGLLLLGAAGILYAADLRRFVRAWGRALDVTRVHWQLIAVDTVLLSVGLIAYAAGVLPDPIRWIVAGVSLFLTGWVTLAITGQAYKITPFLMWYYRFALGMPAYDVPRLEAPYWPRSAVAPLSLLAAAGPLISLGVLVGLPWMSGAGGAAYFLGACLFSWLLGYSWLPRLWTIRSGAARPLPPR
jgi:hypothetical protein